MIKMVSFLNTYFLGARVFVWLYLFLTLCFTGIIFFIVFKEHIKYKYYRVIHPEKLLKIVIHYPNNYYDIFFRLMPVNNCFNIAGQTYSYNSDMVTKNKDFFAQLKKDNDNDKKESLQFIHENITYDIDANYIQKQKWCRTPEIHYFFNNASPIKFLQERTKLDINANQMSELKENDLFSKLLSLKEEKNALMILFILTGINIIISVILALKVFGVLNG